MLTTGIERKKTATVEANISQTEVEKSVSRHQEEEGQNDTKTSEITKEGEFKTKRGHQSVKKCPFQTDSTRALTS